MLIPQNRSDLGSTRTYIPEKIKMQLNIKREDAEQFIQQAKRKLKENLADVLEGQDIAYFAKLASLAETGVPREIQDCLKKTVNEVNSYLSPSSPEVQVFAEFVPYDNRFSLFLETEDFKGTVKPIGISFPGTKDYFPHDLDLHIRGTLDTTDKYQRFLRDIFRELILYFREWTKNRFFELLEGTDLTNKIYGVFPGQEKEKKDILKDLYFAPTDFSRHDSIHYLINPFAAEEACGKLKKIAYEMGTIPLALLIELARTPIDYDKSFARLAEGKNEPFLVDDIDKKAEYRGKYRRYFRSEKAVMGNSVYVYEICDAGEGDRLFAEYPVHREDITGILDTIKSDLKQAYCAFIEFERRKKKSQEEPIPESTKVTRIGREIRTKERRKATPAEVAGEIKFIVDMIKKFPPVGPKTPYILNEIDSLGKSGQNDKVAWRRIAMLSRIFSFLTDPMPKGLEETEQYRDDRVTGLIEDIKQIMAEKGLILSPSESEKVTAEIRAAVDNALKTPQKTPYDYPKLELDWKQNRIRVHDEEAGRERWQNAKEYLCMIYGEKEKREYGELCLADLNKINPPLGRSLETLAYRKRKKPRDFILTVPKKNTRDLERCLSVLEGDGYELKRLFEVFRRRQQRKRATLKKTA
jgi:hypothetical protein